DVLEDADGSLLVIDTGGWYTLCCPTSHVDQSLATGGIYRLRQRDVPRPADPRGELLEWSSLSSDALVSLLGDPRPAVRSRARQRLVASQEMDVIRSLGQCLGSPAGSALGRVEAVWCLVERIGIRQDSAENEAARRHLVAALDDPVATVQLAA